MENKYFTPDIEETIKYFQPDITDLRVGYECEIYDWAVPRHQVTKDYRPKEWKPKVWTEHDFDESVFDRAMLSEIRVPYLTKEQIEAEGWEITAREVKEPPYKVDWINAKKGEHTLWINLAMHNSMHLGISDNIYNVYRGHCKDITTFRYICKLLNI